MIRAASAFGRSRLNRFSSHCITHAHTQRNPTVNSSSSSRSLPFTGYPLLCTIASPPPPIHNFQQTSFPSPDSTSDHQRLHAFTSSLPILPSPLSSLLDHGTPKPSQVAASLLPSPSPSPSLFTYSTSNHIRHPCLCCLCSCIFCSCRCYSSPALE